MFTGIIETLGEVTAIRKEGSNIHFTVTSDISNELKIDQSVSHNGVCLTVVEMGDGWHTVTAIEETMIRSNLGSWAEGSEVNLERAMMANARLDGHMVQGHVDSTATCKSVVEADGSWYYTFEYAPNEEHILVDKGSVCVNGVSLTVVSPVDRTFQVAIIPYTYEHTNFHGFKPGDQVNIEFDIIGKYIVKHMAAYKKAVGM
ncbi:MAG: riboflavin synthase [Polaribacter sp.]|jgi:riboflavin synthase